MKLTNYYEDINSGKLNANVAPLPSLLFSAHILPPWASTIFLEIYKPNPVPSKDFVANLVNNLGITSGFYSFSTVVAN
jgi:hypothetical protein